MAPEQLLLVTPKLSNDTTGDHSFGRKGKEWIPESHLSLGWNLFYATVNKNTTSLKVFSATQKTDNSIKI